MARFTTAVLLLTLPTLISSSLILPPLLNISQNLPISNHSNSTTNLHTSPKPYWVVFPVPGADLILEVHLSPIPSSHPLRPNSIPILLDVVYDVADQLIHRFGRDTPLERNLRRERNPQEFEWETGTGVRLLVLKEQKSLSNKTAADER
ncbi:hypothetical protein G7Y79_00004g014680 [Physcia stellaris]|nr:hypothetical protein G7Y79_00004g014680 [Physcia stellaris]